MIPTVLLIAGVAIAFGMVYVVATQRGAVLVGENTAVGLADPGAETLVGGGHRANVAADWQLTAVTDLTDAEELLDCLENQGIEERELLVLGNSCFAVRWR